MHAMDSVNNFIDFKHFTSTDFLKSFSINYSKQQQTKT